MVVGYDITICRDNHTRTSCYTLWGLNLALATATVALTTTKETAEWIREEILKWIAILNGLNL